MSSKFPRMKRCKAIIESFRGPVRCEIYGSRPHIHRNQRAWAVPGGEVGHV
jgi:Fe-S-cluster containining protein